MKKSIYYLIANAVSTIIAAIFIGIVNYSFPLFGTDLVVTKLLDCWEPMKIALPVLTLSIIVATRDIVVHKENPNVTLLDKILTFVTGVATLLSIGYTWSAAMLELDGYIGGQTVQLPLVFIITYVVSLGLMYLSPIISKKNANLGASFIYLAILYIITSIVYECLNEYLAALISCASVAGLATILALFLSFKKNK